MASELFLSLLRQTFPPVILARVVASLRQDELVWKALDDETFATMAIDRLGGQANNWTPAALSLISINQKELGAKLTTLPMQPLDANLRHLAVRTYEEVRKRGTGASGLQEACLLALALRERRRLTGSWAGMVDELLTSPAGIRALSATLWRTVVACLLGFVPNQAELFESLVGSAFGEAGLDWVSHYFLTQPDDEQLVGGRLSKLMGTIEIGKQTRLLRLIKRKGGDAVAAFAVVDYLDQSTMPGAVDEEKQLMTVEELAAEAVRMQQTAMLRSVEGNLPEALRSLDRAGKMLDIFQKGIQLQAAELGEKTVGTLGWLSVDHPVKTAKSILHEASFLVSKVEKSERVSSMPTHGAPLFEILSAEWIKDVQPGKAREQARKAANEFISATSNGYVPTEFVNQWDVVRVIHILDELGAKEEALAIGEQELCLAPANVELLSTVSDLCQKSGDLKRAKELAASAAFLAPEQLGYRRNLARLHSLMNEWPQAYRFYKEVTSESLEADVNDRIELARSAMKSNELEVAAEVCEQLLREQEDLGAAHGLLGLTRVQQGRSEDAVVHLNRATLISPEQAEWWLALANHYENASDKRAALETLRAAVLSAPQSAELHYRLGEMLLEGGMTADALPCLKRAVALIPENIDYALRLAATLRVLGYMVEAKQVLAVFESTWTSRPDAAYEYALILSEMGEINTAIRALEFAANLEYAERDWTILFARLLMDQRGSSKLAGNAERLAKAETHLRKLLTHNPDDLQAALMLGDALRRKGDVQAAYQVFHELVERPDTQQSDLLWKVQHGFGLTALDLGQIEPGIALLREAAHRKSDNLMVQQDLANACISANLVQDAAEAAEVALEIAPDDTTNLDWFADAMVHLGKPERAGEALRCALELSPESVDLRVRYARLALENGHLDEANDILGNVTELDGASPDLLRQTAYLQLRMQNPGSALNNLEKAAMLSEPVPADLLYDLASVYHTLGRDDEALDTLAKAGEGCVDPRVCTFHADLLASRKQFQSALQMAERALNSEDSSYDEVAGIHRRCAEWLREIGNISSAFEHAEKAVEILPDDLNLRFIAADLATAMIQPDKASKYALLPYEAVNMRDLGEAGVALTCLSGHLALEENRFEDAQKLYQVAKKSCCNERWVAALEARLYQRQGELLKAAETIRQALSELKSENIRPESNTLWTARAAFESYLWDDSLRLYDTFLGKYPAEARGSFELARALIEGGEIQHLCDDLAIERHAPGLATQSEEYAARVNELLESIGPMLDAREADRWSRRAKLVRQPNVEDVDFITRSEPNPVDAAVAMACLRVLKNAPAALELAERAELDYPAMVQKALSQAMIEPAMALSTSAKLVNLTPNQPVHYAVHALLSEGAGQLGTAIEAIENALTIWPDEPAWHAKAAHMAREIDDLPSSIQHWGAALNLRPDRVEYAVELGQAYYLHGEVEQAAVVLNQATELDPANVDAWLMLSQTQKTMRQYDQAIISAMRAGDLEQDTALGMMMASQIAQDMGNPEKALDYARSALQKSPRDSQAVVNLSRILNKQGRLVESLSLLDQSMEVVVSDKELQIERARLVYQISGAASAMELVGNLAGAYPDDAEVLALQATVQAEMGDLKNAERAAFHSLRLQPHQPDLALTLGRMMRRAGQLDQAVHLVCQAIAMSPDNIEAYLELGQAYVDRREHSNALQTFQHATKVAPKDPRGYYNAAIIMKETKDYQGAESMLQQAARFAPEDLLIHRQLVGVMALNLIHKSQEANTPL